MEEKSKCSPSLSEELELLASSFLQAFVHLTLARFASI
jgi:hypothetical protein